MPKLLAKINEMIRISSSNFEAEHKLAQKQKNEAIRKLDNLYKFVEDGIYPGRINKHR